MRYLYSFSLLFILASCQKDEKKVIDHDKTDWAFYKLNGNVKSITTKSWEVNEKLEKVKTMHEDLSTRNSDLIFDEDGLITNEKTYLTEFPIEIITYKGREQKQEVVQYIDNQPVIKTSYDWDTTGKNNIAITKRNGDNSQIDRVEIEYHQGYPVKKTTLSAQNIPTEKTTYINDSKGNVLEEDFYLETNSVQYKAIYKYDKKGNVTSDARYSADGKKLYETISAYKGNNMVKRYTVNDKGIIEYSEDFTYDAKGNKTSRINFIKPENSKNTDKFVYDDKGNKVSWQVLKNDILLMTANFAYDSHNNQTLVASTDSNINEVDRREYSYEYDKKGNWTKKTVTVNNKPGYLVERTIIYYNN